MKRSLTILAGLVLAILVSSQSVWADHCHKDSTDLTAEQQGQIAEIHKASKASIKALLTPGQLAKLAEIKAKGTQCGADGDGAWRCKGKLAKLDLTEEQSKKVAGICVASARTCKAEGAGKVELGGKCPKEAKEKIKALLMPEQLAKLEEIKAKSKGRHCCAVGGGACGFKNKVENLDLTEEQSKKIDEICKVSGKVCKAGGAGADKKGGGCPREMKDKIKALLTPEQLAKLKETKGHGKRKHWAKMLEKLELTEGQQEKITAIRKAGKAQAIKADGKESRKAVYAKMKEDINAVLTADQQKTLIELRKAGAEKGHGRKRGGGLLGHGLAFKKSLGQLDLSEEQEKQIGEIYRVTKEKIKAVLSQKPADAIVEKAKE